MASSGIQYGTTNPRGMDPWPIESTLAPLATAGSSANAQRMLGDYQTQREIAGNVYAQDLDAQHAFAYQQLANQMKENYIKAGQDAVQHRGGLSVLGAMAPDALQGLDPNAVSSIEGGLTSLQNAQILKDAGAGAYSSVEAGRPVTDAQAYVASGGLLGPQGIPLQLQIAREKEAAAASRQAASAKGEKTPGESMPIINEFGTTTQFTKPKGWTHEQFADAARARGAVVVATPPANQPLPPADGSAPPPPPPPGTPPARTSLQPNAAKPPTAPQNTQAGAAAVQQNVKANLDVLARTHPEQIANIKAGMAKNNGVPIVRPKPGGGWSIIGGDGTAY